MVISFAFSWNCISGCCSRAGCWFLWWDIISCSCISWFSVGECVCLCSLCAALPLSLRKPFIGHKLPEHLSAFCFALLSPFCGSQSWFWGGQRKGLYFWTLCTLCGYVFLYKLHETSIASALLLIVQLEWGNSSEWTGHGVWKYLHQYSLFSYISKINNNVEVLLLLVMNFHLCRKRGQLFQLCACWVTWEVGWHLIWEEQLFYLEKMTVSILSVSKVMHDVNKTFHKCHCSNCAFAGSYCLESLPRCSAALWRGYESFGAGFCPWRPERSWKTSFLGLQFNSAIRWLPRAAGNLLHQEQQGGCSAGEGAVHFTDKLREHCGNFSWAPLQWPY